MLLQADVIEAWPLIIILPELVVIRDPLDPREGFVFRIDILLLLVCIKWPPLLFDDPELFSTIRLLVTMREALDTMRLLASLLLPLVTTALLL